MRNEVLRSLLIGFVQVDPMQLVYDFTCVDASLTTHGPSYYFFAVDDDVDKVPDVIQWFLWSLHLL